ncbi:Uracil-DNA glycosylase, family 4 [hydrothermal vent metagenome]|uniref:Type-4 uracil-DNA glycosylase n=1 Tax=hydrothermal vent metagenome TaxID=652676 RepID=A0A3B1ARM5_9ZZZZ
MDKQLRRQYLETMGITIWVSRQPNEPAIDAAPQPDEERHPADVNEMQHEQESPRSIAAGLDWAELQKHVSACKSCDLHKSRTQTVFGVGSQQADLLIIGEAPGADEDRQGEPFVGRAGKLLNAMLQAIGLVRNQVYIANILKCRPPGNRDPHAEETMHCEPYLMRQIELIRPKVIMAVGRVAAQNLLKSTDAVGRMRGRIFHFGAAEIPLVVSYHPAYLLRSPEQKAKAWQDLQQVMKLLKN